MSAPILLVARLLLALSLYAFLGWALLTLWRDIQRQGASLAARKVPLMSLTVQAAASAPLMRNFSKPEVILGRDPDCELALDDETVSARHARLTYHHGQWWLEDLGSTNGTFLNSEPLSTPTVVTSGDRIGCGQMTLVISLPGETVSPPTQKI